MSRQRVTILDGGMGRELKRMGAPFRQPEWSALALIDAPAFVLDAHLAFVAAGCDVVTSNSYAIVPFHIGEERFAAKGRELADLAGRLSRQAAASAAGRTVRVAGSLPPLFGSYRPDLFDAARAPAMLATLVGGLSPHVDLWLGETLSAIAEAQAVAQALQGDPRPRWFSFTIMDGADDSDGIPRLRSGETVESAAEFVAADGAEALLFNCSQPEAMKPALDAARATLARLGSAVATGVYANAFPPQRKDAQANETVQPLRDDLSPPGYLEWARRWVDSGATIVGGCCGIGPEHIEVLARMAAANKRMRV